MSQDFTHLKSMTHSVPFCFFFYDRKTSFLLGESLFLCQLVYPQIQSFSMWEWCLSHASMLPTGVEGTLSPFDNLHHWPVVEEKMSDTTSALAIPNCFGFGDSMVAETVLREEDHFRNFFCRLKLFTGWKSSYPENGRGKAKTESRKKMQSMTGSEGTNFPL